MLYFFIFPSVTGDLSLVG